MHTGRIVYRFGPFELDPTQRRLRKGDDRVPLADRPLALLICLVENAGRIVDKETLIKAAWPEDAVSDDSLRQGVNAIRQALGCQPNEPEYVETRIRKGYEFTAPVHRNDRLIPDESLEDTLDSFRAFVTGRAGIQSLDLDLVNEASQVFERLVRKHPGSCAAHVGLANACLLTFEATRADMTPNVARLKEAEEHAWFAVKLNDASADAWGTVALVRHRLGNTLDAKAAARKSIDLEPADWLHHLRHSAVSWGQERISAARRALAINRDLALAHWLAATVYVARTQFDHALEELRSGCALQDAPPRGDDHVKAVGLHWLHGLVLAANGAVGEALAELDQELATADERHVYGREARANTWYAIGALRWRQRKRDEAMAAFQQALTCQPGHPLATIALNAMGAGSYVRNGGSKDPPYVPKEAGSVEAAIATAVALVLQQKHDAAARVCEDALNHAPPGSAGWILPVEPLLHVTAHRES